MHTNMAITPALTQLPDGSLRIDGRRLDVRRWATVPADEGDSGRDIGAAEAAAVLAKTVTLHHLVIGVIGPRDATDAQRATAEQMGRALGALGLTVICGGRSGVMEAVCKGVDAAGGLAIGILPGSTPDEANPFVAIPLPTGLGEARNMIIAKSARVLIAVGGSYGTLSEVAYGLHFGKAVIGLEDAPQVAGVRHASNVADALEQAMAALFGAALPVDVASRAAAERTGGDRGAAAGSRT